MHAWPGKFAETALGGEIRASFFNEAAEKLYNLMEALRGWNIRYVRSSWRCNPSNQRSQSSSWIIFFLPWPMPTCQVGKCFKLSKGNVRIANRQYNTCAFGGKWLEDTRKTDEKRDGTARDQDSEANIAMNWCLTSWHRHLLEAES